MANNLIQQAQQLKAMIEQAKQQCVASRDANLQQLKAQMEKEKQDVSKLHHSITHSIKPTECSLASEPGT